jgi:pheromone shutdown-related protein TraB
VRRIVLSGRQFVLVGTAHVSSESVAEVRRIVAGELPDVVCVELDESRHRSLTGEAGWHELNIGKVLRDGKGFLLLANLVLSAFQRRLGSDLGVKPGEEMLAAMQAAQELSIPCVLADRDIQVTLRRAWSSSGWWGRSKMLAAMITAVLSNEKLEADEIERLKESDVLAEMMKELADYLPPAKRALIDERDRWLAVRIHDAAGAKVVAVVGAGHLEGIVGHLEALDAGRETADVSDISGVPPRRLIGRVLPWLIPAVLVALFVAGFFISGPGKSFDMLWKWVVANGGLAAIGSLLCLAHPLTILVAFLGAPVATLNPFLAIGFFTGTVEAFLRKPRVSDFERLQQDVATLKGFYWNRVTHILLVFFLSSMGGVIGNIIAIPWLTSLLGGK